MCRASSFECAPCYVSKDNDLGHSKDNESTNSQSKKFIHQAVRSVDGPPDLDEIWKKFNLRLKRLFDRNYNNSSGPDNNNVKLLIISMLISAAMIAYVCSGLFIISQGQTAVVMRFGRYTDTVGYGVHWRLPYPFGWHEVVDTTQLHTIEISRNNLANLTNVKDSLMLTRDSSIINISFLVKYKIFSAIDYLLNIARPEHIILQAAQSAVRTVVGSRDLDDIFSKDITILQRQLIDVIQNDLDSYRAGIKITDVEIRHISLPQQVKTEKMNIKNAQDSHEVAKHAAQVYANDLLQELKRETEKMINDAILYSENVISHANGDVERFKKVYAQYLKAPDATRERMYLETMQEIYSNSTKIYIDNKDTTLYLKINKLVHHENKNSVTSDITSSVKPNSASTSDSSVSAQVISSADTTTSADEIDDSTGTLSRSLRDRTRNRSRGVEFTMMGE
ncbi:MAG: FtsH protease activity modulator HflK [Burkholderia sp.]|nr:FtsH protease activity modulator HflK [Burkholderia sp.]